jgi:hypothetical protein
MSSYCCVGIKQVEEDVGWVDVEFEVVAPFVGSAKPRATANDEAGTPAPSLPFCGSDPGCPKPAMLFHHTHGLRRGIAIRRQLAAHVRYNTSLSPPLKPLIRPPPKVIFSGIQPTGIPHLGNYLGALRQWVKLQDEAEPDTTLLFSIVDLHAVTIKQDPSKLARWRKEMLASLYAIGLKKDRSIVFYQSAVPQHAELMWLLSCNASMGYLSRMTQWKVNILNHPTSSKSCILMILEQIVPPRGRISP